MHEQNTSISNITTYTKESKHVTSTTHIPQPATTLLTASPNPSHAPKFMSSQCGWACTTTFQLEGGVGSILGKWELHLFISIAHTNIYGSMWTHLHPSVV